MKVHHRRPVPNGLIRAARQRLPSPSGAPRSMSRQELADAVNAYLRREHQVDDQLTQDEIGRIERGQTRWPGHWRRLGLRAVLGAASDAELGLYFHRQETATVGDARGLPPERAGPMAPAAIPAKSTVQVAEQTSQPAVAAAVADPAHADVLPPRLLQPGAGFPLSPLPADPDQLEHGNRNGVAAYAQLSQCLWRMYWTAPARLLFDSAYAHVRLGADLLSGVAGADRQRAAEALALSALLAARLAFFDLNRPGAANQCHQVALGAAREAEDRSMIAAVLGHMAFGPAFRHNPGQATELTSIALRSAQQPSPMIRSWLHCVASEAEARAGNGTDSIRQIDLAESTLATSHDEPVPDWFDFYDSARLHCFAGYAALAAGDHTKAADRLTRAAAELGPYASKQRSVVCADLATACQGDAEQATHHLSEAIDSLQQSWYRGSAVPRRYSRQICGLSWVNTGWPGDRACH